MSKGRRSTSYSKDCSEITAAMRQCRLAFVGVGVASGFVNVLMLSGSLYMLQIYDRVLPSRSVPTLVALTLLVLALYIAYGFFDLMRMNLLGRIGKRFDRLLRERVFAIYLALPLGSKAHAEPLRDLDQIRNFLSSFGPTAFCDLPWLPLYLLLVFLLHPLLGLVATLGACLIFGLTLLTEHLTQAPMREAVTAGTNRHIFAETSRRNAEAVKVMGMRRSITDLWVDASRRYLAAQQRTSAVASTLGTLSKLSRMFLQSAVLGLGAYLVIRQEATGGIIIAASIVVSRALAPVETAIANWKGFVAARQSYRRLSQLLAKMPDRERYLSLPLPRSSLDVEDLFVFPPEAPRPVVQGVCFRLMAGSALGIIGPSGSGKSSLVRALVGAWAAARGKVRLDGATLDQWDTDELGKAIGYLPQDVELFGGTFAENIARFDPVSKPEDIIAAAMAAGIHDLAVRLPNGYETKIGEAGSMLSGGQRQRLGLARALYGRPFLLVLDEPTSNLDAEGEAAVTAAIREARLRGAIVIVVAHRPSTITAVDHVLVLQDGRQTAFGPKETVLRKAVVVVAPERAGLLAGGGTP
jgi:PrtD family type I secretion system ABC transporter